MRRLLILSIALVAGCATTPVLDSAPPPGVDLSGQWHLNVADSDDPLRIPPAVSTGVAGGGAGGNRGSRGGGQNGPRSIVVSIPVPVTVVAELLRWPGNEVAVHQDGGAVTFTSDGDSRLFQPVTGMSAQSSGHAAKRGRRNLSAAQSGWAGPVLVVRVEPDEDQLGYEARYRLSDDGSRLFQVIVLRGGRLSGFTLSRVWDRE